MSEVVSPNTALVQSNAEVYVGRDILVSAALNRKEMREVGQVGWGCGLVQTLWREGRVCIRRGAPYANYPIVASQRELNLNSLIERNFTGRGRCGTRLHSAFCELVDQGGPVYIYYPEKVFLRAVGP